MAQELWAFSIIIYLNGTGVILSFIGRTILLIYGFYLKKYAI